MIKNLILPALRRKTKKKKKSNDVLGNFPSPSLCLVKFFQKAEGKRMFSFHSKRRKKRKQTLDLSLTCWCLTDILAFSLLRAGSRVTNPGKHNFSF